MSHEPESVLMVHNAYRQLGGEDASFEQEATLLRSRGHRVIEYRRSNAELPERGLRSRAALAARLVWARDAVRDLRALITNERPDILHLHNTHYMISPAASWAARGTDTAVVQRLPNYRVLCANAYLMREGRPCEDCVGRTPPWPALRHGCYRGSRFQSAALAGVQTAHRWLGTFSQRIDAYVVLTDFATHLFARGGLPREKLHVKANFVDPDPGARDKAPSSDGGGDYALFAGRLSPEKGLDTLLAAFESLPDVPLVIAGDGPEAERVHRAAACSRGQIEWVGWRERDELIALMKGARALLFPSHWYEGFPVTIAQAFACGLPVIASRLGAMRELVTDGTTGLHANPGDARDWAERVARAWEHPEELEAMGRAARSKYEQSFTADQSYQRLLEIYRAARATRARRRD